MDGNSTNPLAPIVKAWLEKISQGKAYKDKRFGLDADEAMKFFNGPYDWIYGRDQAEKERQFKVPRDDGFPAPSFQMAVNKVAELVDLFGPSLYHRNPQRTVTTRKFPDVPPDAFGPVGQDPAVTMRFQQVSMQMQARGLVDGVRATLFDSLLNRTPDMLGLKNESRYAVVEALIKGMGCLWTDTYRPAGSTFKMVGSFYDSVNNLVIDPDFESLDEAQWIARRCVHPVWMVERMYGLQPGTIRGNFESANNVAESLAAGPDGNYLRKTGVTNDLLVYWKIYSKMGCGGRIVGVKPEMRGPLEQFGDFCYLAITDALDYPLNVPPSLSYSNSPEAMRQIAQQLQWPTPHWADGAWPMQPLSFHWCPNDVWPISHIAPGMGELKFLNWLYSFIAGKLRTTCRDFLVIPKSIDEEVFNAIKSGEDLTLLKIDQEHAGTVANVCQFLQHPQFNKDVWSVAEAIMHLFEQRTGLSELMYGESSRQMRSAAEAQVKQSATSVRPDDMANKVEDWMTDAARAEALASRWHLTPKDVEPILGPMGAEYWAGYVWTANPAELMHSLEFRIEAGSTRKPNRDRDVANANNAIQTFFQPLFMQCQAAMNMAPVNALLAWWGKTQDADMVGMGIQFPTPVLPPQPGPGGPPAAGPQQGGSR